MTPRRVVPAAVAFLGILVVMVAPAPSDARPKPRPLIPMTTTSPTADEETDAPPQAALEAGRRRIVTEATLPGFTFPRFSFGGVNFPGFTIPPIVLPDVPGFQSLFATIQAILNSVFQSLCGALGIGFCASP